MAISKDQILKALSEVKDPELGRDVVSLGFVKEASVLGNEIYVRMVLTTPARPARDQLIGEARSRLEAIPGVEKVHLEVPAEVSSSQPATKSGASQIKNVIAVASGKGGVGKSTVAVNLAVALSRSGASVGLLDADIYGASVPSMLGVSGLPEVRDNRITPLAARGIQVVSMGFFSNTQTPVIWRGPLIGKAVKDFLELVNWSPLDYLIVDLPPGTGDSALSLAQSIQVTGVVVVTTPQEAALQVAGKALYMFRKLDIPILGIIENMSYFVCPHCGQRTEIFSHGGGKSAAEEAGVPFLGEIPIDTRVRESGDVGIPLDPKDSPIAKSFADVAKTLAGQISILNYTRGERGK
ncbi:MAG TPA: Mrp/NBP35 family ATP-binding protein [Conexivisphaerales archaeon]|nr:Mrp/NBP35 family ATP-binding protein [Conexivisphaerales archaeon]